MSINNPQRLYITLKQPNPLFEKWLESWLTEAEKRQAKSQYKLREALHALRSYPLPLSTGRECGILRGFGLTLCNRIDNELRMRNHLNNDTSSSNNTYQQNLEQVMQSMKKAERKKPKPLKQPKKITKKAQKAFQEEKESKKEILMTSGSFQIWLLVDIQETKGKNKSALHQTSNYLKSLAIEYEIRRLTIGDFLWVARDADGNELVLPYIVERKRMDDLASSIRDGRFHEQKHRLRQSGIQNVIYLVEDYGKKDHLGLPLKSLHQAMTNTQVQSGFSVIHTENHYCSIVYLQSMTQIIIRLFKEKVLFSSNKEHLKPCKPQDNIVGLLKFRILYENSSRNAQLTVREVFIQQLVQLRSLSLEKAIAIVECYPTPRLLFDAYESCDSPQEASLLLANIRSGQLKRPIGAKISQTIYNLYNSHF